MKKAAEFIECYKTQSLLEKMIKIIIWNHRENLKGEKRKAACKTEHIKR